MNDRTALELLVTHGPLTRTRLGELTGLSKPTASQLLARLEAAGLVRATGTAPGGPGPAARLYGIVPAAAHVVALAVDQEGITAAVADITGRVLGERRVPAPADGPPTVCRAAASVREAVAEAGLGPGDIHRAVIGMPGALDPRTGELRYAPHLSGWQSTTLRADLAGALGTPVVVENDVNLAAVAERQGGAARDVEDFVLVWVDDGVGAAVVLGGRPLRGFTGGAGEIGYMPLPGAPLARGGPGAAAGPDGGGGFQRLVGGAAVRELARAHGIEAPTAAEAVAGALRTPGAGDRVLDELAGRLATGLAAVVSVVDPELVVLSGRTARAGGERLRERVAAGLTGLALPAPRLRLSAVDGPPVLAGALCTALAAARDAVFDTA
ncbi:ROK family transcriptional regulator [Streptomyces pactum]|uniref:ROK family transcriptional regulator n=1 Tax=Streptomyces pactum TaxID=68249 RepID=UPI0036FF862C